MHPLMVTAALVLAGVGEGGAREETSTKFAAAEWDTIEVRGRFDDLSGVAGSASEASAAKEDIRLRPILREAELLETIPGLIATQHSGDGKSNQMFLRGFNLDHGTDFRTQIEGMPVNLPTHGHGHGYTDVNFLIPELVETIEFRKGVYHADLGDFGSAGAARFRMASELRDPFLKLEVGEGRYRRAVGAGSRPVGPGELLAGAEVKGYDGPWDKPQDLRKLSGVARYTWLTDRGHRFSILGLAYRNEWQSSDQIPRRLVEDGTLGPFGQVDDTLGGESRRHSLEVQWRRATRSSSQRADLWWIDYDLDLFSNFTYFLEDPASGDQIEQVDDRTVLGGQFEHEQLWSEDRQRLSVGIQSRLDLITDVGLHRTVERRRVATIRSDEVRQSASGIWARLGSTWWPKIRTEVGIRGDVHSFDVESRTRTENSGSHVDGIWSPKLGVTLGPWARVEIYANAGLGFHSNDARGTTITVDPVTGEPARPVDPLVRSRGAELGIRMSPVRGLRSTLAVWALNLDSELLFVGDAGTTEPTEQSHRTGVELANFWRPSPSLALDLDVALTRARFEGGAGGEDRIPGALESVVAAGIAWELPRGFFGSARIRHLGEYPLIEDGSIRAEPTTLVNASLGYRFGRARLALTALNLLDERDSDIQYYYSSRVVAEPAGGIEDVHFHPVEPFQLRTQVSYGL